MRRRTLLPLALALTLTAGCGLLPGDSDGTPRERFGQAADEVRSAIEAEVQQAVDEARNSRGEDTGDVDQDSPPPVEAIRTDTNTAFDYDEYNATLEGVIGSLQEYWSVQLPQTLGVPYSAPTRYAYYRPDEGPGPSCGQQQAPPKNAFYCPVGDFIAWDETGLLIPYYVAGDFAAAYVLAHEYGHAVQVRLRVRPALGVLRELQADCFAGAWSKHVEDQGLLEAGDLTEATMAIYEGRDLPDTQFTDPQAHGSAAQRGSAFEEGFREGPTGCRELQVPDA